MPVITFDLKDGGPVTIDSADDPVAAVTIIASSGARAALVCDDADTLIAALASLRHDAAKREVCTSLAASENSDESGAARLVLDVTSPAFADGAASVAVAVGARGVRLRSMEGMRVIYDLIGSLAAEDLLEAVLALLRESISSDALDRIGATVRVPEAGVES